MCERDRSVIPVFLNIAHILAVLCGDVCFFSYTPLMCGLCCARAVSECDPTQQATLPQTHASGFPALSGGGMMGKRVDEIDRKLMEGI